MENVNPNAGLVPSIFDGAGAIEKVVSSEAIDKLDEKVAEQQAKREMKAVDLNELMLKLRTKPVLRDYKKIGRNDSCPCGSGKKYKNCCLSKGTYETYHQFGD